MKTPAPNKLFIHPDDIRVQMIPGGALPNVGIQYVRKDVLIDFLKEKIEEVNESSEDSVFWGMRNAFKQMYDKINSL